MPGLAGDLRYALRQIRRAPVFSFVAVLTLALSIGGTVTIFSFVNAILLKPLAYQQSGQLTVIWEHVRFLEHLFPYTGPNPRQVFAWRQSQTSFSQIVLVRQEQTGVSLDGTHPEVAGRVLAETGLLHMLGVRPAIGRDFVSQDGSTGHTGVAIISYRLWQSIFNGAPDVVGRTLYLGPNAVQVIGVLPKAFYFPRANELSSTPMEQLVPQLDVLQPVAIDSSKYHWNEQYGNFTAIGRLKPGVTLDQARAQLDALCERIARQIPPQEMEGNPVGALSVVLVPLKEAIVGKTVKPLWLLLATVLSVLLVACVNLANAQLARAMQRDREAAVRVALGSSLWSLLRAALLESLALSVVGASLGVLLAQAVLAHFGPIVQLAVPRAESVTLSAPVLLVALGCTVFSTLSCGLLPALRYRTVDPRASLQGGGRTGGSTVGVAVRRWLVAVQLFACTALLLLTALFASNMLHLLRQDRGFAAGGTMLASVRMQSKEYTDDRRIAFDEGALQRMRRLPGVTGAALTSSLLSQGQTWVDGVHRNDGASNGDVLAQYRWISPEYFSTLGQRIITGRPLDARDRQQKTAVISESLAEAAWHGEQALGRTFQRGDTAFTVVGIAADARSNTLRKTHESMVYLPFWDNPQYQVFFLVHGAGDATSLADGIRNAIWAQDAAMTIDSIGRLDAQVEDTVAPERIETMLLAGFGVLALVLAVLGVYGTLNYSVERRVQEFGIRMALGAGRASIYGTAMREIALPVAAGLAGGCVAGVAAQRAVQSLLEASTRLSAALVAEVVGTLVVAAVLAAWVPCWHAAHTEPMDALRTE